MPSNVEFRGSVENNSTTQKTSGDWEADRESFLKEVIADLDFRSSTITDRCRTISLGIIALCWAFMIGDIPKNGLTTIPVANLLGPTFLALCSILADYAQSLFGYMSGMQTLRKAERAIPTENIPKYDDTSLFYKIMSKMFYVKQLFCLGASLWFILAVLYSLWSVLWRA